MRARLPYAFSAVPEGRYASGMAPRRANRMIPLGHGKHVRADRVVALEPLSEEEGRGDGARTRVWVDGLSDPVIGSRSERTILEDMGESPSAPRRERDEAEAEPPQPGLF